MLRKVCVFSLPVFGILASQVLAERPRQAIKLEFVSSVLPESNEEFQNGVISKNVNATYGDGSKKDHLLTYHELFRTGDKDTGGNIAGIVVNQKGEPVSELRHGLTYSTDVDNNTIHQLKNGKLMMLTHLESRPGAVMTTLIEKSLDGTLKAVKFGTVDFSSVGGTTRNCAGSKTPWGTHLAAEEDSDHDPLYFDPTLEGKTPLHISQCVRDENGQLTGEAASGGNAGWCKNVRQQWTVYRQGDPDYSPYEYGFHVEVGVDELGNARVKGKHKVLTLGKGTSEMALVMPDRRTVYNTDDGDQRAFTMLITDKPGDLHSGKIFMTAFDQKNPDLGIAGIRWIYLGQNNSPALSAFVKAGVSFSDFWDLRPLETCPLDQGFRRLHAGDTGPLCLRFKDGKNGSLVSPKFKSPQEAVNVAAFLETRRFGAWKGGATEFTKMEAISLEPSSNRLYMAMSVIRSSMITNKLPYSDIPDQLRLTENLCGAVFGLDLGEDKNLGSSYIAKRMEIFVAGKKLKPGQPYAETQACHPDLPGNPDNLNFIGGSTLIVGEDSGFHLPNLVMAIDTKNRKSTRIASLVFGAEGTGMFQTYKPGNETYLFFNTQSPFDDRTHFNAVGVPQKVSLNQGAGPREKAGRVGYIRGIPALRP